MKSSNKSKKPKHTTKPRWHTVIINDYEEMRELQTNKIKELQVKHSKKGNIIHYGMYYPYGNYFGHILLLENLKYKYREEQ